MLVREMAAKMAIATPRLFKRGMGTVLHSEYVHPELQSGYATGTENSPRHPEAPSLPSARFFYSAMMNACNAMPSLGTSILQHD